MCVYFVEIFAYIECYSDCSRRGSHLVELLSTVLFYVCSAVTIECCVLYQCCACVCDMSAVMQGSVFAVTERRDMDLYEGFLFAYIIT